VSDSPWLGDACSLVDAYRSKQLSPVEALDACVGAIERSTLNAFCHLDLEAAREAARTADVSLPFGGVPMGVKELDAVTGWPDTEASLVFADRVADHDSNQVSRLRDAGAVLVGQTTASEFGGINVTFTKLHGATGNPWGHDRTPGGSSGGSAAAVAGGLVPIATGGDGGGSIRIPAAFCGLPGLKASHGRIGRGPGGGIGNVTTVTGCLSRSVRDIARWLDVCAGPTLHDPLSLPATDHRWEAGLGSQDLAGLRVAIAPGLGVATVHPEVEALVREAGEWLARTTGMKLVDVDVEVPTMDLGWALTGMVGLLADLDDRYPDCADQLTPQIAFGLKMATELFTFEGAAESERRRRALHAGMAALFEQVDVVVAATNPDTAFPAKGPMPTLVGDVPVPMGNNGALTIPSNMHGNPAITVPVGITPSTEHPAGMQLLAAHHREALLLDLALHVERERPWPLVAPCAPC
jgi:Asp-tRNA(Asn)/Glu-tRNA(Gln) amidotransferase A subunit family amidase